jgi:hypothetical protein
VSDAKLMATDEWRPSPLFQSKGSARYPHIALAHDVSVICTGGLGIDLVRTDVAGLLILARKEEERSKAVRPERPAV